MRNRMLTWLFGIASGLGAMAGVYVFLSAVATASMRFGYCGPSSLEQIEEYCRVGTKLLLLSYALGACALIFAALSFWLFWRRRRTLERGPSPAAR